MTGSYSAGQRSPPSRGFVREFLHDPGGGILGPKGNPWGAQAPLRSGEFGPPNLTRLLAESCYEESLARGANPAAVANTCRPRADSWGVGSCTAWWRNTRTHRGMCPTRCRAPGPLRMGPGADGGRERLRPGSELLSYSLLPGETLTAGASRDNYRFRDRTVAARYAFHLQPNSNTEARTWLQLSAGSRWICRR